MQKLTSNLLSNGNQGFLCLSKNVYDGKLCPGRENYREYDASAFYYSYAWVQQTWKNQNFGYIDLSCLSQIFLLDEQKKQINHFVLHQYFYKQQPLVFQQKIITPEKTNDNMLYFQSVYINHKEIPNKITQELVTNQNIGIKS
eukprot:TRINITY_DN5555_c0_g1_i4.p3 TRINITY_DN5555_c0_g1~~TRINITY_DN5555_c0_g1_i4.p3  ORF type:complete len:143 (-),score=6.91 TRINITY_DN5555_c0_g1_i4:965-1393(-)